jgi:hypothetical protein
LAKRVSKRLSKADQIGEGRLGSNHVRGHGVAIQVVCRLRYALDKGRRKLYGMIRE